MKEQRENSQATFGYMPQDYVRAAQMRRKEAAAARLAARRQAVEEEAVQKAFSRLDREKQNRAEKRIIVARIKRSRRQRVQFGKLDAQQI